jgi:tripartite-type tricarboxylate transporter receptor subunit TctC
VPTFQESGMPGFTFNSWFAMVAPAGTPAPIIKRLNDEVRKAVANPELQKQLAAIGVTPRGTSAADFGAATKKQFELYRKVIQDNKITAD